MAEEKNHTPEENKKEELRSFKDELKEAIPEEKEERLEFLKREEIRTMKKDIEKLREVEAEKEKERITALESEKEIKKEEVEKEEVKGEEVKKPEPEYEPQPQGTLIPTPPKKASSLKKVLVRIGFVLIFIFILGFIYWFFAPEITIFKDIFPRKEEPVIEEEEPVTEEEEEEEEEVEIFVPSPFISVEKVLTFEISENEEIPPIIEQLIIEELPQNSFTQIVIKNEKENQLADLEDIAQAFQIETVPEVIQKLDVKDFNLLIYPQEEGRKEVFIIKIKEEENLPEALKIWETKITQEGLFISNNKISTISSSFKTFVFKEDKFSIRYLTISKNDSGVCYTLFENYLILSSSFKSMQKAVRELRVSIASKLQEKIGQLFIVGFEGKTLTSQLEDFFKKYKPGGVLLLSKNIEDRQQLKSLIKDLQDLSKEETGFSLFVAVDQEGGPISRIAFLEEKTAQSEIEDTYSSYEIGLKRGEELKELGVNVNLAPLLDYMKEEDFWFNRSFQKSPQLSGELAKSLILGQKEAGILTAIKHFPGYVNIPFNPEVKLATVLTPEISQFKKAMEAKPELIMVSNTVYTDIDSLLPFTFSQKGIQYLKTNLDSEALIISDDLAQNSLLEKFSIKEIVTKPIKAGVDMLIFSGWGAPVNQALDSFLTAAINKEVSETKIDIAVSKIIQLKETLLK